MSWPSGKRRPLTPNWEDTGQGWGGWGGSGGLGLMKGVAGDGGGDGGGKDGGGWQRRRRRAEGGPAAAARAEGGNGGGGATGGGGGGGGKGRDEREEGGGGEIRDFPAENHPPPLNPRDIPNPESLLHPPYLTPQIAPNPPPTKNSPHLPRIRAESRLPRRAPPRRSSAWLGHRRRARSCSLSRAAPSLPPPAVPARVHQVEGVVEDGTSGRGRRRRHEAAAARVRGRGGQTGGTARPGTGTVPARPVSARPVRHG
uniref:Uncharacterized protein n=1 Tax=Oryza nivara TaxID=4536 RepID=A0A0E0JAY8_ORYNI